MVGDALIHCRVPAELKQALREAASREQLTESALLRQLLQTLIRLGPTQPTPQPVEVPPARDRRLYVRLSIADRELLDLRAGERDMASATYAAILLRAHLRGVVPLPKAELLALRKAVSQAANQTRTLQQILVHPQMGAGRAADRANLAAVLRCCAVLRDLFKALLVANERSWRPGDG